MSYNHSYSVYVLNRVICAFQTQGNILSFRQCQCLRKHFTIDEINICDIDLFVFDMERFVLVTNHFKHSHKRSVKEREKKEAATG